MRVIGAVETRKGNNARIRIVSFKRKNAYVTRQEELQEAFPPDGFVFAPLLSEKFEVDDLIEFQTIEAPYSSKPGDDVFLLDRNTSPNFAGYQVLAAPYSALLDGCSLDFDQIETRGIRPNSEFYLLINNFLYGPLKKQEDYLQPVKDVFQIAADTASMFAAGDKLYLLAKPAGTVRCDAMNQEQLADWFKDQMRNLGALADLQSVRQAVRNHELTALDGIRLKRAISSLDQLLLNQSELKLIAERLTGFSAIYERALAQVYDEIAAPVRLKVSGLEQQIASLTNDKEQAAAQLGEELKLLEAAASQLENLQTQKGRLIEDIKIHALINPLAAPVAVAAALVKYDIQDYAADAHLFPTLDEFIKTFKQSLAAGSEELAKSGHALLLLLKDYKCLLSAAIEPVLQISRLSNNAKVVIQQVEPDWLKYDQLYAGGLKYAWESALSNPAILHFFILEDLNLSSPECYAKPLNDLLAETRRSLPGLSGRFPLNLWIIGVPLPSDPEQEFGLPLLKHSFRHWGAVPVKSGDWGFKVQDTILKLSLATLTDHQEMAATAPGDYFPAS